MQQICIVQDKPYLSAPPQSPTNHSAVGHGAAWSVFIVNNKKLVCETF